MTPPTHPNHPDAPDDIDDIDRQILEGAGIIVVGEGDPHDGPLPEGDPVDIGPDPWGDWDPIPALWLTEFPPPRDWVFRVVETVDIDGKWSREATDGFLPLGKVGCLAGAGGIGKSMVILELAMAAATGGSAINDLLRAERPFRTVYLAGEEDQGEAQRRLYRAAQRMNLDDRQRQAIVQNLMVVPLAGNAAMALTDPDMMDGPTPAALHLVDRLRQLAKQDGHPLGLVVLDPLARFAGLNTEKDNGAATRFVQVADMIASIGPTVLVVHHTSQNSRNEDKSDTTGVRGVTALTDGFRWVLQLKKDAGMDRADWAWLALTKSNYTRPHDAILLRRVDQGGWTAGNYDDYKTELEEAQKERWRAEARKTYLRDITKKREKKRYQEELAREEAGDSAIAGRGQESGFDPFANREAG